MSKYFRDTKRAGPTGLLPSDTVETSVGAAGCVAGAAGSGTLKREVPGMLLLTGGTGVGGC